MVTVACLSVHLQGGSVVSGPHRERTGMQSTLCSPHITSLSFPPEGEISSPAPTPKARASCRLGLSVLCALPLKPRPRPRCFSLERMLELDTSEIACSQSLNPQGSQWMLSCLISPELEFKPRTVSSTLGALVVAVSIFLYCLPSFILAYSYQLSKSQYCSGLSQAPFPGSASSLRPHFAFTPSPVTFNSLWGQFLVVASSGQKLPHG